MTFANGQKGWKLRIFKDYLLKKAGIDSSRIPGYDRDMTTHKAVAAPVNAGTADVGAGVFPLIHRSFEVLCSKYFKENLEELGRYEQAL